MQFIRLVKVYHYRVTKRIMARIMRFKAWQKSPFSYKRDGFDEVVCKNCGTTFAAGYCPVCGQQADTPRITARSMLLRTLDVWGLGNRSMPRTMLHLILRPGYMISDYIKGRRQPYFPPIKMLFVLGAFYLLSMAAMRMGENFARGNESFSDVMLEWVGVSGLEKSGGEVKIDSTERADAVWSRLPIEELINDESESDTISSGKKHNKVTIDKESALMRSVKKIKGKTLNEVVNDVLRRTLVLRLFLLSLLYALFTKAFFRKSKECEAMNYTEMFFAQILMFCQMLIVGIVLVLMGGKVELRAFSLLPGWLHVVLFTVNYKQMFGLNTRKALFKTIALTVTVNIIVFMMVVFAGALLLLSVMVVE
ncbi:MAG: DUF3667 domain-containing protein [Muribaculaceae bacterium]